jgi:hypothetical protein
MRKFIGSLMLCGVLTAPVVMSAKDHDDHRYYDRDHKDYHVWNNDEDRAYRHWVTEERHQPYREWKRANRRQQQEYWRWRHEHSDWR